MYNVCFLSSPSPWLCAHTWAINYVSAIHKITPSVFTARPLRFHILKEKRTYCVEYGSEIGREWGLLRNKFLFPDTRNQNHNNFHILESQRQKKKVCKNVLLMYCFWYVQTYCMGALLLVRENISTFFSYPFLASSQSHCIVIRLSSSELVALLAQTCVCMCEFFYTYILNSNTACDKMFFIPLSIFYSIHNSIGSPSHEKYLCRICYHFAHFPWLAPSKLKGNLVGAALIFGGSGEMETQYL